MILHIDDKRTIADLQERFSKCFPLLKLEFFRRSHKWKQHSSPHDIIDPMQQIGSTRKIHEQGLLDIKSWFQTGKVEREFRDRFGLFVQVYRKRNNSWVQTISTDNLTLNQQSKIASQSFPGNTSIPFTAGD